MKKSPKILSEDFPNEKCIKEAARRIIPYFFFFYTVRKKSVEKWKRYWKFGELVNFGMLSAKFKIFPLTQYTVCFMDLLVYQKYKIF